MYSKILRPILCSMVLLVLVFSSKGHTDCTEIALKRVKNVDRWYDSGQGQLFGLGLTWLAWPLAVTTFATSFTQVGLIAVGIVAIYSSVGYIGNSAAKYQNFIVLAIGDPDSRKVRRQYRRTLRRLGVSESEFTLQDFSEMIAKMNSSEELCPQRAYLKKSTVRNLVAEKYLELKSESEAADLPLTEDEFLATLEIEIEAELSHYEIAYQPSHNLDVQWDHR